MIYFDNGATTFPKPSNVNDAVNRANKLYGANPGRGGHQLAIKASEMVYDSRKAVADFFGALFVDPAVKRHSGAHTAAHGVSHLLGGHSVGGKINVAVRR